jgi:hypothetical protein
MGHIFPQKPLKVKNCKSIVPGLEQYRRRLTSLRRITAESIASHRMECNMKKPYL